MKKILLSMAAVAALGATAIPATAQPWRGDDHRGYEQRYEGQRYEGRRYEGQRLTGRYDALEWQITSAARERRISGSEARQLLAIWRDAQPLAWRVETGRASGWERQRVMNAMNRIENSLQRSYRYSRYDDRYDDRYERDWRR